MCVTLDMPNFIVFKGRIQGRLIDYKTRKVIMTGWVRDILKYVLKEHEFMSYYNILYFDGAQMVQVPNTYLTDWCGLLLQHENAMVWTDFTEKNPRYEIVTWPGQENWEPKETI